LQLQLRLTCETRRKIDAETEITATEARDASLGQFGASRITVREMGRKAARVHRPPGMIGMLVDNCSVTNSEI